MKISLTATVAGVRFPKSGSVASTKVYVTLLFLGGSASIPAPAELATELEKQVGQTLDFELEVRPVTVTRFDRPVVLFEPVAFCHNLRV